MAVFAEIELKFAYDGSAGPDLRAHPVMAEADATLRIALEAAYFDTADRRLRQAGMTLRVRTEDGRIVQTLKCADGAGIDRTEFEREIDGPEVDRRALRGSEAAKLLKSRKLSRVFTVSVARDAYVVRRGASEIEVAVDEGRIAAAGSAQEPVREIELELKHGDVADLFALARELGESVALRPLLKSKAERGYALADGGADGAVKAAPVPVTDEMTAAEALQAIVHSCLRHMQANETTLRAGRNAEALHQTRVAARRLRSALSLFKPIVRDGSGDVVSQRLKALIGPLGRARDLDVLLTETLPAERKRRPDETGLLNLEKQLEVERDAAYAAVFERLASKEWRETVFDILEWANAGAWLSTTRKKDFLKLTQPAEAFAREALERRRKQIKQRGARLDEIDDEERHRVRIAAKKLRYGSEFFAALYEGRRKRAKRHAAFVAALKAMQDELGLLNDLATAGTLVPASTEAGGGASAIFAAGVASADMDRERVDILDRAKGAHRTLLKTKPFWR